MIEDVKMKIVKNPSNSMKVDASSSGVVEDATTSWDSGGDGDHASTTEKKFQKENTFLSLLPYYDSLKKETESILEKTIGYLGKAILRHDFQEGVVIATKRLTTYVELYGLKFTKEQHVRLINVYLELLTMNTCPLTLIPTLTGVLSDLLSTPKVLTRDELSIPWRPLYETRKRCSHYTLSPTASTDLMKNINDTIWLCNKYLEKGTFPEVVAELKPMLCPSSPKMQDALLLLGYFIPFSDPDAEEDVAKFLLELWEYYEVWSNRPQWEGNMEAVFGLTAWYMPRSFDWTPHLPMIYARLIKRLKLPVYLKEYYPYTSEDTFDPHYVARLIVGTLGTNQDAMFHLKTFLNSIETFLHPSCERRTTLSSLVDKLVDSFFSRVTSERYKDSNAEAEWWYRWPQDKKLTDQDIDDFVNVISKLVLELYLDAKYSLPVINNLALMRPQLIVPAVMEKYSEIVDTVTEHEKYMHVVRWVSSSLLSMLKSSSWKEDAGYDGRHLVLPFVQSLLPAIDPNDMPKTLCALNQVTDLILLLPLVDCSALVDEAETEAEKELCRATACLEELVLQILERVLGLIQCRKLEDTRIDCEQQIVFDDEDESLEKSFWDLFLGFANHSSTNIFQSVASQLARVALTSTLETVVSGRLFAIIVQCFGVARPDIFLPMMLPQLCTSIHNLVTDDVLDEEKLDPELHFQLLLLSRIVGTNGKELLKYRHQLEATLITVLKLNGKKGYELVADIITNLLQSLAIIYPLESRVSETDYDDPKYMATRDWGITMEAESVKPTWHIPSEEELQWAKSLFLRIFTEYSAKFEVIDGCAEKQEDFNKRLLKYMNILFAACEGISTLLKFWDETPMEESLVDFTVTNRQYCGIPEVEIVTPETGENIMLKYYKLYCSVQTYLEKFKADDTDGFCALMRGFYSLVVPSAVLQKRSHSTCLSESVVNPQKKLSWTRAAIIKKTYELHLKQIRISTRLNWTSGHALVFQHVFQLCVNRYAKVRLDAQNFFFWVVDAFSLFEPLIPRTIQPFLIEKLQEGVPHDEYKGALYLICGWRTLLLKSRWQNLCELWTALVKSPFWEKNTIIWKMIEIQNLFINSFIHSPLEQEVPKDSRLTKLARELLPNWGSGEELGRIDTLGSDTSANQEHFTKLLHTLIQVGSNGDSDWRKKLMTSLMLWALIPVDGRNHLSEELVTFYLNGLISTVMQLRELAMLCIGRLLRFFKREYHFLTIDVEKDLELAPGESIHSILQYTSTASNSNTCKYKIKTQQASSELYVHKPHYGFSDMPTNVTLKQPVANFNDLSTQKESRQLLLKTTEKFFTDEDYVTKLMEVWSHEKQGEVTSWIRFTFVKLIARNNGPQALGLLLKCARQFGVDKDQWKQRCAADVLCGIMRGLKLWDDEMVSQFWTEHLNLIFTECLNSVTQETMVFWCTAIDWSIANRDPNKLRFFIQFLKERFIGCLNTAQTTSVAIRNEMTFYKLAVWHLKWRGGEEYVDTFALVKSHFLDTPNPYMNVNVRCILGLLLATCLEWDLEFSTFSCDLSPKYEPFIKFIFQNLEHLEEKAVNYQADVQGCEVNEEIRQLLLKFKTVLEWIRAIFSTLQTRINHNIFYFIPLLCQFESFQADPEVSSTCGCVLANLARTQIHPRHLDGLLHILRQASGLPSWKARVCLLEFLKVFALHNINILMSNERWSEEVCSLVLKLLVDRKIEVRENAYKTLSGFLHGSLIKDPMKLLAEFQRDAFAFANRRCRNKRISPEEVDALHSSILGLCAFVEATPYQIPQYLPDVLVSLNKHLCDPQPIPATVRKCLLDFRHRHQDDWNKHKTKFTEDELYILNDVFVSPNYYV